MRKSLVLCCCVLATYAHAQTVVNSAMFGMMEARTMGPGTMSGRITAIEGVNKDGKTIYVGTAGGGVWKSTNAGASFVSKFDKYCQSIGSIAINQQKPSTVYVGTGESNMRNSVSIGNGMYKTTDGGDNWTKIGLDSTEHIAKVALDPNNPEVVYVAAPGALWSDSKHRGLYKSTDGGATWEKILYINEKTGCSDILIDPKNPNTLYATMWQFRRQPFSFNSGGEGSGLYKSTDGGKTWKELKNGLPAKPFGRIAMTLAPSAPDNLLAIVESKNTGLYISSDGGETWKNQSATMNVVSRPFYFSAIAIDPNDPKRVYRPGYMFSYSEDGGYSFTDASYDAGWVHSDMHALWINPINTNILYVGTDGGVYTSLDRGITWQFAPGLPVGQFYHVAYDFQKPYSVYGGLQDNGSWKGPSAAPGGINNAKWENVGGGDGFWATPDLSDPKTVYTESQGGEASRVNMTNFKSETIQPQRVGSEEKLRWNWNTPIVLGAKNFHHLYMGSQYLYLSTTQGRTWTRISPDLTTNDKTKQKQEESGGLSADNTSAENHCTIFTIAESPLDDQMIWVGTDDGNLQYTLNGGKTWTNVSAGYVTSGIPKQTWVSSIEPSHFNKNEVYATFDNHSYGDHQTYLAKSSDLGKTWTRISSTEFTGFAHKIKEDLVNKNLLFLGTEMGLFASLDGGANWFRMKNKIPEYALVRDIQIHPKTHDLIIATHGRGIYILDDIRAMRNLTKEIWEKDVYLFPTPDMVLSNGRFGNGGAEAPGGWNTGNPYEIPTIDYYLKDRLNSGDVTLDILDASGKLVQSIPGGKRRGINKISWNLRGTPPKVSKGSTKIDYAGFVAPMVLPGKYTARLKIKDKEYSNTFNCVHDSTNKELSLADRKEVYKQAMRLYKLFNDVNTLIDTVGSYQTSVEPDTSGVQGNTVKAFLADLASIKGELTATKQTSIFADEERLREKVSKLYQTFCNTEVKPSNLQLDAINVLEAEYQKQAGLYKAAWGKYRGMGK